VHRIADEQVFLVEACTHGALVYQLAAAAGEGDQSFHTILAEALANESNRCGQAAVARRESGDAVPVHSVAAPAITCLAVEGELEEPPRRDGVLRRV